MNRINLLKGYYFFPANTLDDVDRFLLCLGEGGNARSIQDDEGYIDRLAAATFAAAMEAAFDDVYTAGQLDMQQAAYNHRPTNGRFGTLGEQYLKRYQDGIRGLPVKPRRVNKG